MGIINHYERGTKASGNKDLALLALTGVMLHLSRMSHHKEGGGGIMVGTYYLPQILKREMPLSTIRINSKKF